MKATASIAETGLPENGKAEQDEIRVDPWIVFGEVSV